MPTTEGASGPGAGGSPMAEGQDETRKVQEQLEIYEHTLGHSPEELERLERQADYLQEATRDLLVWAGLGKGMRVLDLGAGAGDVSLLAAELVGDTGRVVAIEPSEQALNEMSSRLAHRGLRNVRTIKADDQNLPSIPGGFDAVVGRLIMVHVKDPAATLQRLLKVLRPGGIIAFQEIDIEARCWSEPHLPLVHKCYDWIVGAFTRGGMPQHIGRILCDAYVAARLTNRHIVRLGMMESDADTPAFGFLARTVKVLAPAIEAMHIATREEMGVDTLEDRLRAETVAAKGHFIPSYLLNAWARKPL